MMNEHQHSAIEILATENSHRAVGMVISQLGVLLPGDMSAEEKKTHSQYEQAETAVLEWAKANGRDLDSPMAFEDLPHDLENRFRVAATAYCLSRVELD